MDEWARRFGDQSVALVEITEHEMQQRLIEAANVRGGSWNPRSVGWWFRRNTDKVIAGRVFRREDRGRRWRLEGAKEVTAPNFDLSGEEM
jgi:hypothetical protein